MRYVALVSVCLAAIGPTPTLAQTVIGKHTLGETFQDWFAAEGINLEQACQQGLPEATAQLQRVFMRDPGKDKSKAQVKMLSKSTAELCKTLLSIQQTGAGTLKPHVLDSLNYTISRGSVTMIQRMTFSWSSPTLRELQFLIDRFGPAETNETRTYQNGYGAKTAALRATWALPNGDTILAVEDPFNLSSSNFLVRFMTREYLRESTSASKLPNPYGEIKHGSATASPALQQVVTNSEAAMGSPAAAAAMANVGHASSPQELAEMVQKGQASKCAVVTVPPGAEVLVDGNRLGVSPLAFVLLKQGETPRTVTVKMNGYNTIERKLIPDGKTIPIALTLKKE